MKPDASIENAIKRMDPMISDVEITMVGNEMKLNVSFDEHLFCEPYKEPEERVKLAAALIKDFINDLSIIGIHCSLLSESVCDWIELKYYVVQKCV